MNINNYKNVTNTKHKKIKKILILILVLVILIIFCYTGFVYVNNYINLENNNKQKIENIKKAKALEAKIEAKKKEPVYISLPNTSPVRAIVDDYSLDSSVWALVSKTSQISLDYIPNNLVVPNVSTNTDKSTDEQSVRSEITEPLKNLFDAANTYGYQLMIGSGYRSADLQATYFYSLASSIGEEAANQSVARPGQSEHQTGLAVDISTMSRECYLTTCFADTNDGKWLENNSYKFGFILRYPEGKESITGYSYEPWHFRYVGIDLATAIYQSGLTFDEAWTYLEAADNTLKNNGAI